MTEVLRVSKESSEVLMFARLHGNGDSESLYVSSRFVAHVVTAANTPPVECFQQRPTPQHPPPPSTHHLTLVPNETAVTSVALPFPPLVVDVSIHANDAKIGDFSELVESPPETAIEGTFGDTSHVVGWSVISTFAPRDTCDHQGKMVNPVVLVDDDEGDDPRLQSRLDGVGAVEFHPPPRQWWRPIRRQAPSSGHLKAGAFAHSRALDLVGAPSCVRYASVDEHSARTSTKFHLSDRIEFLAV